MMNYKYILFDLDGTLIDTNRLIIESFKHTYKCHLEIDAEEQDILKFFGEPLIVTLRRASEEKADEMFKTYIEYNESIHDSRVTLCRGIPELLERLKLAGCRMAVVTSKRKKTAIRGLALFDLLKYFEEVVTLEDTEHHKPHPAPLLKALELLDADPAAALMVGDSIYDIQCAHAAGVKSVLVEWSAAQGFQGNGLEPDYIAKNADQLLAFIGAE